MEYPVEQAWASPWGCELGQEQMNQHDYDQDHFEPRDSIYEALYYNADLADLGFDPATAVDDFYNDCDFGLGLESETQFGLSLDQFADSRTASSEDYVALAYMFNPPTYYVNPEDLNQAAMASSSLQLLSAGYPTASPSTATSSSPALTHSQLFDAASEHEQTPGSDFASQASPAVSQGPYPCAQCNKSFSKRYDLTRHVKTHTRPFPCPLCSDRFGAKKTMDRHLWAKHEYYARENDVPSPLKTCPVKGCTHEARADNLKRHLKLMHGR